MAGRARATKAAEAARAVGPKAQPARPPGSAAPGTEKPRWRAGRRHAFANGRVHIRNGCARRRAIPSSIGGNEESLRRTPRRPNQQGRRHLPPLVHRDGSRRTAAGDFSTLHQARAAYERDYILKKLDEHHGNVSRTAEVLGLERSHLYRKMKTLGIAAKE